MATRSATLNDTYPRNPTGKNGGARGDKTSEAEIMRRVDVVEEQMTRGLTTREITQKGSELWGVSPATMARYISRVRETWREQRAAQQPFDQEESIARLTLMARTAKAKRAWALWGTAERLLLEVKGAYAPQRVDHRVAALVKQVDTPADREPVQLAIVERLADTFLDELERVADEQMKALPAHSPDVPT